MPLAGKVAELFEADHIFSPVVIGCVTPTARALGQVHVEAFSRWTTSPTALSRALACMKGSVSLLPECELSSLAQVLVGHGHAGISALAHIFSRTGHETAPALSAVGPALAEACCGRDMGANHVAAGALAVMVSRCSDSTVLESVADVLLKKLAGARAAIPVWQCRAGLANALRSMVVACHVGVRGEGGLQATSIAALASTIVTAVVGELARETHDGAHEAQLSAALMWCAFVPAATEGAAAGDVRSSVSGLVAPALAEAAKKRPRSVLSSVVAASGADVLSCSVCCFLPSSQQLEHGRLAEHGALDGMWEGLQQAAHVSAVQIPPSSDFAGVLDALYGKELVHCVWKALGSFGGKLSHAAALTDAVCLGVGATAALLCMAAANPTVWDRIGDASTRQAVVAAAAASSKRGAEKAGGTSKGKAASRSKSAAAELAKLQAMMKSQGGASSATPMVIRDTIDIFGMLAAPGCFLAAPALTSAPLLSTSFLVIKAFTTASMLVAGFASGDSRFSAVQSAGAEEPFVTGSPSRSSMLRSLLSPPRSEVGPAEALLQSLQQADAADVEVLEATRSSSSKKKGAGGKGKKTPSKGSSATPGSGSVTSFDIDPPRPAAEPVHSCPLLAPLVQMLVHPVRAVRCVATDSCQWLQKVLPATSIPMVHAFFVQVASASTTESKAVAHAAAKKLGLSDVDAELLPDAQLLRRDPVAFWGGTALPPSFFSGAPGQQQVAAASYICSRGLAAEGSFIERESMEARAASRASPMQAALRAVVPSTCASAHEVSALVPVVLLLCHHPAVCGGHDSVARQLWRTLYLRLSATTGGKAASPSTPVPTNRLMAQLGAPASHDVDRLLSRVEVVQGITDTLLSTCPAAPGSLWSLQPQAREAAAGAVASLALGTAWMIRTTEPTPAGLHIITQCILPAIMAQLQWVWKALAPRIFKDVIGSPFMVLDGPAGASSRAVMTNQGDLFSVWTAPEGAPAEGVLREQTALARKITSRADAKAAAREGDDSDWLEKLQAAAKEAAEKAELPVWSAAQKWAIRRQARLRRALNAIHSCAASACDAITRIAATASPQHSSSSALVLPTVVQFVPSLTALSGLGIVQAPASRALKSLVLAGAGTDTAGFGLLVPELHRSLLNIGASHVSVVEAAAGMATAASAKAASHVETLRLAALGSGSEVSASAAGEAAAALGTLASDVPSHVKVWVKHGLREFRDVGTATFVSSLTSSFAAAPPSAQTKRAGRGDLAGGTEFACYTWPVVAPSVGAAMASLSVVATNQGVDAAPLNPAFLTVLGPLFAAALVGPVRKGAAAATAASTVLLPALSTNEAVAAALLRCNPDLSPATLADAGLDVSCQAIWDVAQAGGALTNSYALRHRLCRAHPSIRAGLIGGMLEKPGKVAGVGLLGEPAPSVEGAAPAAVSDSHAAVVAVVDLLLQRGAAAHLAAALCSAIPATAALPKAAVSRLKDALSACATGSPVPFAEALEALLAAVAPPAAELEGLPAGVRFRAYLSEAADALSCLAPMEAARQVSGTLGVLHPTEDVRSMAMIVLGCALAQQANVSSSTGSSEGIPAEVVAALWVAMQFEEQHVVDGEVPVDADDDDGEDVPGPSDMAKAVWDWAAEEVGLAPPVDFMVFLLPLLSHPAPEVRDAAAGGIACGMAFYPDSAPQVATALLALYSQNNGALSALDDDAWRSRMGVLSVFKKSAAVWSPKDQCLVAALPTESLLPVLMFIVKEGVADSHPGVAAAAVAAGRALVDAPTLGGAQAEGITEALNQHIATLDDEASGSAAEAVPSKAAGGIFGGLDTGKQALRAAPKAHDHEHSDAQRRGCVVLLGSAAAHLPSDDERVDAAIDTLLASLSIPSEAVQSAVAKCLPALMKMRKVPSGSASTGKAGDVVGQLLASLTGGDTYGDRRGAAYGLAGATKGLGLGALKALGIVSALEDAAESKSDTAREGAMLAFECLSAALGVLFEPYIIRLLPHLLRCFGDKASPVRGAAEDAARVIMGKLTGHGVKMLLPALLEGCSDSNWRSKSASITLLGSMAWCAPKQLAAALPTIVPRVISAFQDAHPKVQSAAKGALQDVGQVIKNPEVSAQREVILAALSDPGTATARALEALWTTSWMHSVDPPALALLIPILRRGLTDRTPGSKHMAATIVGKLTSLASDVNHLTPYLGMLLAPLKRCCLDSMPTVRATAAVAMAALVTGAGEDAIVSAHRESRARELRSKQKELTEDMALDAAIEEELEDMPGVLGWAYSKLTAGMTTVERAGGAQTLAEYLVAAGPTRLVSTLQSRVLPLASPEPGATSPAFLKEGCLWTLAFLPSAMISQSGDDGAFSPLIPLTLPLVVAGLADDASSVRDVALKAGTIIVTQHAKKYAAELLPPLRAGLFAENWRIRENSVRLLGELLVHITTGRSLTQRGTDEFGGAAAAGAGQDDDADDDAKATKKMSAAERKAARRAKNKAAREAREARAAKKSDPTPAPSDPAAGADDDEDATAARADTSPEDVLDEFSAALVRAMGLQLRNEVTADLYCVRSGDSTSSVRSTAMMVFKAVVPHPPRVIKQVLPALMNRVITMLAASSAEHRSVAGRALGDVVQRLGDTVLPRVVPLLQEGLQAESPGVRQGVCLGLGEVIAASSKTDLQEYMETLLPAVQQALCDESGEVQAAAAHAFNTLQRVVGDQVLNAIVPALLHQLDEQQGTPRAAAAMAGLRQVLAVRGDDVLPYLVPKLVSPQPLSAFQLRALANVAEVTGDKIYTHFNLILPPVLDVLAGSHAKGDSSDAAVAARLSGPEGASARTLVTSVRGPGVQWLVVELCQAISEGSATRRWVAASLLEAFVSAASTDFSDQVPIMLKDLIYKLVVDDHEQSLLAVSAALRSLVAAVGVESLQERMGFMRDCLRSAASEGKLFVKPKVGSAAAGAAGGAASGGAKSAAAAEYVVPGLCVPKGLDAFFPVYQQGLVRGAPHVRELAATAVGELVSLTSTKALRPYFMKLTGPLIRVVADKYSAEVKAAILNTLNIIIAKGGDVLRPFVSQLSTSMVRCLQDPSPAVRAVAGDGLGRVMSLSKRVDPIVNEVLNNIGTTIGGVKESMTAALKEVLQHAGSKLTPTMRTKAVSALLPLLVDGDDIVRSIAAAGTGAFLTHLTVEEAMPIVMFITNEDGSASDIAASSSASGSGASGFALGLGGVDVSSAGTDSSWLALHGRLMALRAVCKYCASEGPGLDSLPALGGAPSAALLAAGANPGGKPQVRVAAAAAASWVLRRACTGAAQGWGAVCGAAHSALAALVADPSKDVKAAAFVSLKLACKVPEVGMHNSPAVAGIVQGLAAGVKEKAAVKLAAEQAAYHFLNIQEQGATGLLDGIEDKVDQEAATALKLYAGRVLVKLSLDEDDADEDEDYAGY